MQRRQFAIHRRYLLIQSLDVRAHLREHGSRGGGDGVVSRQHGQQRRDLDDALGRHHAEFRRVTTQGVDRRVRWPTSISRCLRMMPSACWPAPKIR